MTDFYLCYTFIFPFFCYKCIIIEYPKYIGLKIYIHNSIYPRTITVNTVMYVPPHLILFIIVTAYIE